MPHKDPEVRRAWRQAYAQKHYAEHKEYYAHKRDRQKAAARAVVEKMVIRFGFEHPEQFKMISNGWGPPAIAKAFKEEVEARAFRASLPLRGRWGE